jgi:hypothetical protein
MHRNVVCDPQISPDEKTHIQCNMSRCIFCQICTSSTSMKNSSSTFCAQTYQNALRDPQIQQDEKTQVQHNVSWHAFYGICIGPTQA